MNQTGSPDFRAKRVTRSYRQRIKAEPSTVHSLICPVREAEWLDGWDCTVIYSLSGVAEEGCVFVSRSEGEKDTIWLITKRDDERFETEFARITPESRVTQVTVRIEEAGGGVSHVFVTYRITALNEEGNEFVESFTEENFEKDMEFWEAAFNYYLETGRILPLQDPAKWLRYESDSGTKE